MRVCPPRVRRRVRLAQKFLGVQARRLHAIRPVSLWRRSTGFWVARACMKSVVSRAAVVLLRAATVATVSRSRPLGGLAFLGGSCLRSLGASSPAMSGQASDDRLPASKLERVLRRDGILAPSKAGSLLHLPREPLLQFAECCVPELTVEAAKGGAGRLAVVGGSLEYTGAPYFAAAAMLRTGADLSHVFCEESAGTAIKSFSPELIVHPVLRSSPRPPQPLLTDDAFQELVSAATSEAGQWIPRLDGVLIGPGLGRDPMVIETASRLILTAAQTTKPLVLDADGLFILTSALAPRSGTPSATQLAVLDALKTAHVTLTPNKVEWERLCRAFGLVDAEEDALANAQRLAPEVARRIGARTTLVVKGPADVISDGTRTLVCDATGSPRRCGGQGDVLAGLLLTFKVWAAAAAGPLNDSAAGGVAEMACTFAACEVARRSAAAAFKDQRRGMLAGDVLAKASRASYSYLRMLRTHRRARARTHTHTHTHTYTYTDDSVFTAGEPCVQ